MNELVYKEKTKAPSERRTCENCTKYDILLERCLNDLSFKIIQNKRLESCICPNYSPNTTSDENKIIINREE